MAERRMTEVDHAELVDLVDEKWRYCPDPGLRPDISFGEILTAWLKDAGWVVVMPAAEAPTDAADSAPQALADELDQARVHVVPAPCPDATPEMLVAEAHPQVEIPDEFLFALLRRANELDSLGASEEEIRYGHNRINGYQTIIMATWAAATASALGYEVTVPESGDDLFVGGNRAEPPTLDVLKVLELVLACRYAHSARQADAKLAEIRELLEAATAPQQPGETEADAAKLREQLAAIEHERWSHWQTWMHSLCTRQDDGSLAIPAGLIERWERQAATAYADLTEREKGRARQQVDRYWHLIEPLTQRLAALRRHREIVEGREQPEPAPAGLGVNEIMRQIEQFGTSQRVAGDLRELAMTRAAARREADVRRAAIRRLLEASTPQQRTAPAGLWGKFYVERVDGRDQPGRDKTDAKYFVLDYVHDPVARVALAAYADATDDQRLGVDLHKALTATEPEPCPQPRQPRVWHAGQQIDADCHHVLDNGNLFWEWSAGCWHCVGLDESVDETQLLVQHGPVTEVIER